VLKRHLQYKDINLEVVRLILKKNFDATTLDKREKDRIREQLEEAKCHISPDGPKYAWKNPHGQSEVYYWSCICLDIKGEKGRLLPGKIDNEGKAYFPLDGEEHLHKGPVKHWTNKPFKLESEAPEHMKQVSTHGESQIEYWPAIGETDWGTIPGYVSSDVFWFSFQGKELNQTNDFKYLYIAPEDAKGEVIE
jgi:hypothetical protein